MTAEEDINKLIRDIVNMVLGIPNYAIAAKQNAPRPNVPYCDVDLITDTGTGWDIIEYEDRTEDLDINENIYGQRQLGISLGFYFEGAKDNARKVRTALVRESVSSMFRVANIGLATRSEVRDTSEALENGWEKRAQFDIVLNTVGTDTDIITSIQQLNISSEFQTRGKSIPINIEVNDDNSN